LKVKFVTAMRCRFGMMVSAANLAVIYAAGSLGIAGTQNLAASPVVADGLNRNDRYDAAVAGVAPYSRSS
jgi:hypothetical protein